jgi:hypothetical protein
MEYAQFRGQVYLMYIDYLDYIQKEKIYLYSWVKRPGLYAVEEDGEITYKREVQEDDLDFAYETEYLVDYQGQTFETLADISKGLLGNRKIHLYTEDREAARRLGFEAYDNGSFQKGITLSDIDRVTEIKIPILRFKGMETTKTIIEKDQILGYIMNLIE